MDSFRSAKARKAVVMTVAVSVLIVWTGQPDWFIWTPPFPYFLNNIFIYASRPVFALVNIKLFFSSWTFCLLLHLLKVLYAFLLLYFHFKLVIASSSNHFGPRWAVFPFTNTWALTAR